MRHPLRLAALCAALLAGPAAAHEVWIDPEAWSVAPGEDLRAAIRNGQEFEGSSLPWLPRRVVRAEVIDAEGTREIEGRPGDTPAVTVTPRGDGLATLLYVSTPFDLTYDGFETFAFFLEEKGLSELLTEHEARGLPRDDVTESYTRHAKALVSVGEGQGADAFRGMEIELVAEADPYAEPAPDRMTFRLFYRDEPLAGHRVTLFDRGPDGAVETRHAETDAEGRAGFEVAPGHVYLADAVVVREPSGEGPADAMWESLWSSLTFAVPGEG